MKLARIIPIALSLGFLLAVSSEAESQCLTFEPTSGFAAVGGRSPGTVLGVATLQLQAGGPSQLLVTGDFKYAGDLLSDRCSMYDGVNWAALPPDPSATNSSGPHAILAFDPDADGPLSPLIVTRIDAQAQIWRKFDGTSWSSMSAGLSPTGFGRLEVVDFDGAAGQLPRLLMVRAPTIYQWDGASWAAALQLPAGQVMGIRALDEDGPGPAESKLFIWLQAQGSSTMQVIAYNGSAVELVGNIPTNISSISALVSIDFDGIGPSATSLVACGSFGTGLALTPVMVRGSSGWTPLTASDLGSVSFAAVADHDGSGPASPRLYVSGTINQVPGYHCWNGQSWTSLSASGSGALHAIDFDGSGGRGDDLIVLGINTATNPFSARIFTGGIAIYDGATWRPMSHGSVGGTFGVNLGHWDHDGDILSKPQMLALGSLSALDGSSCGSMAKLHDGRWIPMHPSHSTAPFSGPIGQYDPDGPGPILAKAMIGHGFQSFALQQARGISSYDGVAFGTLPGVPVSSAITADPFDMVEFDPDGPGPAPRELVVGGTMGTSTPMLNIAKWNGASWSPLGQGLNGRADRLVLWDRDGAGPQHPVLVAGKGFSASGSTPLLGNLGVWDGAAWTALPANPLTLHSFQLGCVWDPDADGPASGQIITHSPSSSGYRTVHAYDGSMWRQLGSPQRTTAAGSLTVFVLDQGPTRPQALYVVGRIQSQGVEITTQLARWDGTDFVPVDLGFRGQIDTVFSRGAGADAEVFIVGQFEHSGNRVAAGISRLSVTSLSPVVETITTSVQATVNSSVNVVCQVAGGLSNAFQWKRNGQPVNDGLGGASLGGGVVSGSSGTVAVDGSLVLTISGVQESDGGNYTCEVHSPCGHGATTVSLSIVNCGTADFNGDTDFGTDQDIEAFFACLAGVCCPSCFPGGADFNSDGDYGTDQDIEAFFRVLAGGNC